METEDERNQVKFVWEECLPDSFTQYILKEENYQLLGLPTLNYQKCFDIINNYLIVDVNNQNGLVKAVRENLRIFRYVYATLFPKMYSRLDAGGIKEKLAFLNLNITVRGTKNTTIIILLSICNVHKI